MINWYGGRQASVLFRLYHYHFRSQAKGIAQDIPGYPMMNPPACPTAGHMPPLSMRATENGNFTNIIKLVCICMLASSRCLPASRKKSTLIFKASEPDFERHDFLERRYVRLSHFFLYLCRPPIKPAGSRGFWYQSSVYMIRQSPFSLQDRKASALLL